MTGDTIECFNCGRANPAWAQVCRSCGVPIRSAAARSQPTGPIPTDRDSLISIGAGVGSILLAVILAVVAATPPLAYPEVEAWGGEHSGRYVNCALCHTHPDGPGGGPTG